ncbi:MAG: MgtC/SapB family protein [Acidimicrobiia bacterium]
MDISNALIDLVVATGLSALLGLEREISGKEAGLRTHALVGLGAALFTLLSRSVFPNADTARVAAGIVSGVGFLGAGAIFRSGPLVKGLTTAAGLWAVAAVGMAAGTDQILLATLATALAAVVLVAFRWFEDVVSRLRVGVTLVATVQPASSYLEVLKQLESIDPRVELIDLRAGEDAAQVSFLVHPNKAELLGHALLAMDPVVATEVG